MINATIGGLILMGILAIGVSAYLPVAIPTHAIAVMSVLFASVITLLITFIVTRKWIEDLNREAMEKASRENEKKIRTLKQEHDTTTLEKTIRDGTQALIKNALDYFKIENIKMEVGSSAAIENLQLDKYGQIIELLADFSLILPDIAENQRIVENEITHQIKIYQVDENPFAMFLERIMKKYTITVNKKIREKTEMEGHQHMKTCPRCAERVHAKARVCKFCDYKFQFFSKSSAHRAIAADRVESGRRLYREGKLDDALKEFDSAIELRANYALAYYNRAIVHNKLGDLKRAEDDLREASYLGHKRSRELLRARSAAEDGTEAAGMSEDTAAQNSAPDLGAAAEDTAGERMPRSAVG